MTSNNSNNISFFGGVDRIAVLLYALLVFVGFMNIFSASYDADLPFFAFQQEFMKQLMWMGVSLVAAVVILLLDSRLYHMYAYVFR